MSEEVRNRIKKGEQMPVASKKIPMVDLPLGATEDRVCGTIDIEKALTEGKQRKGEVASIHAWRRAGSWCSGMRMCVHT